MAREAGDDDMRSRVKGSIVATIGYVLSPLSWWNDAFVNIPLAYGIGLACGLVSPRLFSPAVVIGYLLTNIAGLALLHKGAVSSLAPKAERSRRKTIVTNLVVSIAYTVIILLLMRLGVLRLPKKGFSP